MQLFSFVTNAENSDGNTKFPCSVSYVVFRSLTIQESCSDGFVHIVTCTRLRTTLKWHVSVHVCIIWAKEIDG